MSQVRVSHLTFAYEGSFENVFTDLSFSFDTDWRLGLVGRKTTLLRLLSGQLPHGGAISASVRFDCFPFPVPRPERDTLEVLESLAPEVESRRIYKELAALDKLSPRALVQQRYQMFRAMGRDLPAAGEEEA